jgi:hypothetical protein
MLFIALVFRLGLVIGCTQSLSRFNNDWDKNIHIVEFSTEDTSETGQVVTNYWKAVIGYKFNRQKIRVDDIIQNPLVELDPVYVIICFSLP